MLREGVKTLVLYLEDWQKRMVRDFLGVDCDTYEVEIETPGLPNFKYGAPHHEESKRMYFTDWQVREMRDATGGHVCEYIELSRKEKIPLYGAPIIFEPR